MRSSSVIGKASQTLKSLIHPSPTSRISHIQSPSIRSASTMTTGNFRYIDPATYDSKATAPFQKPWAKVDGPGYSFKLTDTKRSVENIRGQEDNFSTDKSGFGLYNYPAKEKDFTDDQTVRDGYYAEVEDMLRQKLSGVKKVVIFDHTIRRAPSSLNQSRREC